MIKYKLLYDLCVDSWKQDWEFSKALTDKARTYIIVIGLFFGYSIFNLGTFYASLEEAIMVNSAIPIFFLKLSSLLFTVYFILIAMSLIYTLSCLRINSYFSMPLLEEIGKFKKTGPNDSELEQAYYMLAGMLGEAIKNNERIIKRRSLYLSIAIWCLTLGTIALLLIGSIFVVAKLF